MHRQRLYFIRLPLLRNYRSSRAKDVLEIRSALHIWLVMKDPYIYY